MVAVVQTASHNSGAVTFGAGTTAGNCPVVGIGVEATAAITITAVKLGGVADHFAQLAGAQASANTGGIFQSVDMWADPSCAGSQTAVAITASGATAAIGGVAWEVSGLAATSAALLDKVAANHATSGTWSSGATATTTNPTEFWGGVVSINSVPTGPASPWTNTRPASDAVDMVAGQQVTTATGAATYSGTGSGIWAAAVVTLLPAAGTGTPARQLSPRSWPRRPGRAVIAAGPAAAPPVPVLAVRPPVVPARRRQARAVVLFTGPVPPSPPPVVPGSPVRLLSPRTWPRRPGRAVILTVPAIPPSPAPAAAARRAADYDGKSWWKKRLILRL